MATARALAANDRTLWWVRTPDDGSFGGFCRLHHHERPVLFVVLYQLSEGRQRRDADAAVLVASHARARASVVPVCLLAAAGRIRSDDFGRRRSPNRRLAGEQSSRRFLVAMVILLAGRLFSGRR